MGLTISLLSLASIQVASDKIVRLAKDIDALARSISYSVDNGRMSPRRISLKRNSSSIKPVSGSCNEACCEESSFRNWEAKRVKLETEIIARLRNQKLEEEDSNLESQTVPEVNYTVFSLELVSPRQRRELDAAATKMQKAYKGYRTRRNLADCAVVIEELWWKALDFASLKQSSISFFKNENQETAISRWARARTRAAKVGKGLSKSNNAQKLALQHWLEAIDPRHRYGHNLHLYYDVWFKSESTQPFFYWLDVGDGKEVHLEKCPRNTLQNQSIQYLGPNERKAYEVIVENRKLVYRQSKLLLNTNEGSKWIFVLSTLRVFYVGKKKKGKFQHSSFLAGGAITAAGRLIVKDGILKAIWPYSGHYLPTEEHFKEFINFLEDANVDLSHVKRCAVDDDEDPSFKHLKYEPEKELQDVTKPVDYHTAAEAENLSDAEEEESSKEPLAETFSAQPDARLPCNWTTGAWPRIGCVRDYPTNLQCKALEQVNLSPRGGVSGACENMDPIPSPRPCPQLRLSPRLAHMGIPTPKSPLHFSKKR